MKEFVQNFFLNLSERLNSENNLSDLIWVLSEIDLEFKKFFLSQFFNDIDYSKPIYLQREFSQDNSRPDFVFNVANQEYLIEIKINDKNHHFQPYIDAFKNITRRGYITNYILDSKNFSEYKNQYSITTWSDVIKNGESIYLNKDNTSSLIIMAFISYLKNICNHGEIKHMSLKNIGSLVYFNNTINEILKTRFEGFEISSYDKKIGYSSAWSGCYFSLKKDKSKKVIYPWFGIHYHTENDVYICFDFEYKPSWCDVLKKVKIPKIEGKYFDTPEEELDLLRIKLQQKHFDAFDDKNVNDQQELLKNFFREVITFISQYF